MFTPKYRKKLLFGQIRRHLGVRAFSRRFRFDLSVAPPFGTECLTSLTDAMAYFAVC
jgi:hypothetical protein